MRIAIIAAIHGNLPALEAVLADIGHRNVDRTINLGDCVSVPLWPREVCDLLMDREDLTIRGNHDRRVSGPEPTRMGASDRYAYSQLNQDHLSWLGALGRVVLCGHSCTSRHSICQTCQMLWTTEGPDRWFLGVWSTSSPASATPRFTASGLDLAHTPRAGQ